ncbi:MAG: molybdopterin molybdotransferase MoeA [Leucobacter sp.]|nr:molybdopterin molybdotransferase MoeA [Leucobacter sp.]
MAEMPEAHLAWILERIGRTRIEDLPVSEAHGLALAADARAGVDLPMWDASAMDGYALRAADTAGATEGAPARLRVLGEVAAGAAEDPPVPQGAAVRIMTGAPLPGDADAVAPVEATRAEGEAAPGAGGDAEGTARGSSPAAEPSRHGDHRWAEREVRVLSAFAAGANVRRRGEDVRVGDVIARAGERLGAARLSALAAAGVATVRVHAQPRVAVLSTGSELRPAGARLERGQIFESNGLLISGLLAEAGIAAATVERCADDADGVARRLAALAAEHDVVITTGGVGPGRHDVVRLALAAEPDVRAVSVAVRPGQPQCAGRHRAGGFVFGLPGNPVSAAVSFELFVRPALRALTGCDRMQRRRLRATAGESWRGRVGRLQVLPVALTETPEGLVCVPAVPAARVSHSVGRYAGTAGYALVEAERGDVRAGETVTVIETEAA